MQAEAVAVETQPVLEHRRNHFRRRRISAEPTDPMVVAIIADPTKIVILANPNAPSAESETAAGCRTHMQT